MSQVITYGAPVPLSDAQKILAAAREASKAYGDCAIAVVCPGGRLIAFERADGCQTGSGAIAIAKAKSSVAFKKDTSVFQAQVADDFARARFASIDQIMPISGGVVLIVEGKVIGAVGVSGLAPEDDDVVAKAGAKVVSG